MVQRRFREDVAGDLVPRRCTRCKQLRPRPLRECLEVAGDNLPPTHPSGGFGSLREMYSCPGQSGSRLDRDAAYYALIFDHDIPSPSMLSAEHRTLYPHSPCRCSRLMTPSYGSQGQPIPSSDLFLARRATQRRSKFSS